MPIQSGTHLGPYEIIAAIGAGGMGEVYRARDPKLGRDVAIKVLPEAFADDASRMARFQREAKVLASLSHPNIATIYGLEDSGSTRALVMELVEGPTLADRIKQGPIPVDEALRIAKQITEALEYAHERGIVHRDLKPANVKVTSDDAVKVLDFGLAKALEGDASSIDIATSPTISRMATLAGVLLGTAAYMSPEQAKAKPVDRRADIWAFGCVLYEMLTGKMAFRGESVTDTLAAVIKEEPDWSLLPAATPMRVRALLQRCLQKDPKQRLRDIGDARIALEEVLDPTGAVTGEGLAEPRSKGRTQAAIWGLAIFAALAIGVALWSVMLALRPVPRPVVALAITLPVADRLTPGNAPVAVLSPDGSRLAYVANRAGGNRLYVRTMDGFEPTPIPGTEGAEAPFFSPDGRSVGFFADGKLKTVSLGGGAPVTICNAPLGRGASWGPDDTIVFTPSGAFNGLYTIPATRGTPRPLTTPDRGKGEVSHRWPQILPGGKAVLFTLWRSGGSFDDAWVEVLSLKTGERRVVAQGGAFARYVSSGYVVYARAGGLLAVPFDLKRLEASGAPVSVLQGVSDSPLSGTAQYSVSSDGSLAYVPGGSSVVDGTLVWVNRNGAILPLPAPPRAYTSPRISPDGQRIALGIQGTNSGLWLYEVGRGSLTQLAPSNLASFSAWTPDGRAVTFASAITGPYNLYRTAADGSGTVERLSSSDNLQMPGSWSPDGHVLAFSESDPMTGWHIWMLNPAGDRKAERFLQTQSNEVAAVFSPDGRWLAYQSDESGRAEVYVRPFPGPGGRSQISTEGGTEPMWARNGRELFYRNGDKMMAVTIRTTPTFAAAKPALLFEGRYETTIYTSPNYDVSPDGQRFLMIKENEQGSASAQINIVLNWTEELKRLVPTGK